MPKTDGPDRNELVGVPISRAGPGEGTKHPADISVQALHSVDDPASPTLILWRASGNGYEPESAWIVADSTALPSITDWS
jgi:hypothetical protein